MKTLLINVPNFDEIIGNNPAILEQERGCNPPLGLLYLAGYLEKHSDHSVAVIDSQVERLNYADLKSRIEQASPDVVGITAMTLTLIDVMKTVDIVKQIDKRIKVVIGGPHVFLFPYETINLPNIDYLVIGEGERTFKELLDNMRDIAKLKKIPGLVFKDNGETINTGQPALIENLDDLPFPARHLVPYRDYSSLLAKGDVVTTIFTSRGCPFKCSFCSRPHLGKLFRFQSAKRVVDEIELCAKMGIHEFLFYDDTFSVNRNRVIDVCKGIIKRKLNIRWNIRSRVDTIDDDMLKHLKAAGCQGIHYGVEAGTEKILKVLNKGINLDQVKKTFDLTRKHKIPILAYFMIGNPSETREDIMETFRVARDLNPDYVHMTILTPFPGTKIYQNGLESGVIANDVWKEFARDPMPDFIPPHWGETLTKEELNELLIKGYKGFYVRPKYVLKRLVSLKSFSELKKKIRAGLKVLSMK
ncbi:MAG: cobalamin-dependent protein [Kiritimatiellae bacterium]|nr:cobalamin-dependent protein [Kiritimatiellia bacterium]